MYGNGRDFISDSSVQIVENLIEMDFGDFEGKSADELVKKPEFLEWLKGGADSRPPKGEFTGSAAAVVQGTANHNFGHDAE